MIYFGNVLRLICLLCALCICSATVAGQGAESPSDKEQAASKETSEEKSKEEKAEKDEEQKDQEEKKEQDKGLELDGVFEANEVAEVILRPDEWSALTVVEAVEHGEQVSKGDVLIRLDTEEIDDAIRDAESALKSEELTIKIAEIKFDTAKRNQAMALEAAKAADRIATEDMKEFINEGRERRIEAAERSVQSARDSLEYQEEELRQLEKMYSADDLTEETEEIILKRTRNAVERSKYFLDNALRAQRTNLKYSIPRAEEELQKAVKRAAIALEEAERTAEDTIKQQELALEKQKRSFQENEEKLERLRNDRKLLVVRAPMDGVVYYGSHTRGKWSNPSATAAMLVPGASLKPKTVIMTIVKLSPLSVRANVPEAAKRHVKAGVEVGVVPVAFPDSTLKGTVQKVSAIPVSDGVFDSVIDVELGDLNGNVVPGMKAKVKIDKESE